jgi:thymidylate synthase ThyX
MPITARIVADSITASVPGWSRPCRLTTFVIEYPRIILAEVNTHRALSKSSSSSRAIPVLRQLDRIVADPFMPVEWGVNKPGMQASEVLTPAQTQAAHVIWKRACAAAVEASRELAVLNIHKQIANRVAEPWSHMATVITGTEWANFFTLRNHPMAAPEFQVLAARMAEAFCASTPRQLVPHEWHLPFVVADEEGYSFSERLRFSTARCARVSFLNHDGTKPDLAKDLALYDRLVASNPKHMSPTEHQGTPFYPSGDPDMPWGYPHDTRWRDPVPWSGNLRGFCQHRQLIPDNNAVTFPWGES